MQLCRQFLYSLFECRFTAPGTQCAFGSASRKLSSCSLGCRQLKIMGILAKVFTPNVDFSRSHTPRHSALKDVLSSYPQVRALPRLLKTERRDTAEMEILPLATPATFNLFYHYVRSRGTRLKYYSEKENRVKVSTSALEMEIFEGISTENAYIFSHILNFLFKLFIIFSCGW